MDRLVPFDKGGFDEIGANNALFDIARETADPSSLLLIAAPDEVFLEHNTAKAVSEAVAIKAGIVWFSCYHLIGFDKYMDLDINGSLYENYGKKVIDPHPRVLPRDSICTPNPNLQFHEGENNSMHCSIGPADPNVFSYVSDEICHLHLARAFGSKMDSREFEGKTKRFDTKLLPEPYFTMSQQ